MFKLFINNRVNSSIHFYNYNFCYFRTNKSSGNIVRQCMQKTSSETRYHRQWKNRFVHSNIYDYQRDEDNDE